MRTIYAWLCVCHTLTHHEIVHILNIVRLICLSLRVWFVALCIVMCIVLYSIAACCECHGDATTLRQDAFVSTIPLATYRCMFLQKHPQ